MADFDKAPATRTRMAFGRWQVPLLAAAAVVIIGVATVLVIQSRGNDGGSAGGGTVTEHDGAAGSGSADGTSDVLGCDAGSDSIPILGPSTASVVKSYGSIAELAADSTNIVIAEPTGEQGEVSQPEWAQNPNAPAVPSPTVQLAVSRVVGGGDIAEGGVIDVIQPGTDTDGRPVLTAPARYLLFLAPFTYGPAPDGTLPRLDTYVTLGVVAGMFAQPVCDTGPEFQRLDPESPGLPEVLNVDELTVLPGWSDATYLDSVAAGQSPELSDRSPESGGVTPGTPAQPFDCGGGAAANQVLIDDYVRVGIGAGMFCARPDGGGADTPMQRSEAPLDATWPLRAMVRTGGGPFEAIVAGLVDPTVTRVVAIRGAEDSDNPTDPLKDERLDLYDMGADGAAFLVPDTSYTVTLVLYAGEAEVTRAPLPVAEVTQDPDGVEMYDLRTDIVSPRDIPWAQWRQLDESTVRLFFSGGPSGCYAASVTVDADADVVRIRLATGFTPETEACTANLVPAAVDVPLGQSLADRPVEPPLP